MTLALRYVVRSDIGLLRDGNEDSAYAGPRLLAVADGMGGHAAGEVASAVAISALAPLDSASPGADMLGALAGAIDAASESLRQIARSDPSTEGMGTTVTALLWSGDQVALCHIGDSRAYLLRDGSLEQITHDHTLVQSLVDEGRITKEAAASHPQRSLVLRALQGSAESAPDLRLLTAREGDRYLLCSDGLSDVVTDETIGRTLAELSDLDEAADQLVDLAIRSGGPDNITCVLADVIDPRHGGTPSDQVIMAGAVASDGPAEPPRGDSPAARARLLTQRHFRPAAGAAAFTGPGDVTVVAPAFSPADPAAGADGTPGTASDGEPAVQRQVPAGPLPAGPAGSDGGQVPAGPLPAGPAGSDGGQAPEAALPPSGAGGGQDLDQDDADDEQDAGPAPARRRRRPVVTSVLAMLVAVVAGSAYMGWRFTQSEYYVGTAGGLVAVFRGVNENVAGISLSQVVQRTDIPLAAVPAGDAGMIRQTIPARTLGQARQIVLRISKDYRCAVTQARIRSWMLAHPAPRPTRAGHASRAGAPAAARKERGARRAAARRSHSAARPSPSAAPPAPPSASPPSLPGYCSIYGGSDG